jgi:hypothetical protein
MCAVLPCRILATPGLRSKLDKLMAAKGASFEKEVAYRASQAAGAAWLYCLLTEVFRCNRHM